jgi:hypothetical protein
MVSNLKLGNFYKIGPQDYLFPISREGINLKYATIHSWPNQAYMSLMYDNDEIGIAHYFDIVEGSQLRSASTLFKLKRFVIKEFFKLI